MLEKEELEKIQKEVELTTLISYNISFTVKNHRD
jgi:hypothetical protein